MALHSTLRGRFHRCCWTSWLRRDLHRTRVDSDGVVSGLVGCERVDHVGGTGVLATAPAATLQGSFRPRNRSSACSWSCHRWRSRGGVRINDNRVIAVIAHVFTRGIAVAFVIVAVRLSVTIVVDIVVADFLKANRQCSTCIIVAVGDPVLVIVDAVVAATRFDAELRTIVVVAVRLAISIVVLSVVTVRFGEACLSLGTGWVVTIREAVLIVVQAIVAVELGANSRTTSKSPALSESVRLQPSTIRKYCVPSVRFTNSCSGSPSRALSGSQYNWR